MRWVSGRKFQKLFNESTNFPDEKLSKVERELEESQLNEKLRILRAKRQEQKLVIEQYELEISALEYQVSVIKRNADSLDKRCYKRTRLEP